MEKLGSYSLELVRHGYFNNIDHHALYNNKTKHHKNGVYFYGSNSILKIKNLTLKQRQKIKRFFNTLKK